MMPTKPTAEFDVANNAYADGTCVAIKIPTMWAYAYSGSRCR